MTRTVHLHGMLGRRFGRRHKLDVATPKEAVRALIALLGPKFTEAVRAGTWRVVAGPRAKDGADCAEYMGMGLGRRDLHLVPAAAGSKSGLFSVLAGAAIIGLAFAFAPPAVIVAGGTAEAAIGGMGAAAFTIGGWSVTYGSIAMTGLSIGLSGLSSMLAGTPKLGSYSGLEDSDSQPSMLFSGPVLTVEQGQAVPLVYGRMRVSGCLVSAGTRIEQMGADTSSTLKSKALARMAIALSEGPIGGLVDGAKSIYFGDTPLMASDGTYNFEGVTWTLRTGTPDQEYVPGFPEVESETSVNTEATHETPVVRRMSADCDAVRVVVNVQGLYRVASSIVKSSVAIAIDSRLDSGEWVPLVENTIEGKTMSLYQRAFRVERPGPGDWDLRLRRVTEDRDQATYRDTIEWGSLVEIQDSKVAYADTAVLFLELDSELFGSSIPTPSAEIYGVKVRVPSNYDPATRAYSGLWDGTWAAERVWTDNPVWCLHDLVTHRRYGAGLYGITDDNVDKWSAYTCAQYADGLVDDGYGGQEARFRVACCINTQEEPYRLLSTFAAVFFGRLLWSSDLVLFDCDMPCEPTHIINQTTCVDGVQAREGADVAALYSVYLGTWNDPTDGYKLAVEAYEDTVMLARVGWNKTDKALWGCPSRGQAQRWLRRIAYADNYESEAFTLTGGLHFFDFGPGMAAVNHDPSFAGTALGGKVVSATTTALTLDREVVLGQGDPGPVFVALPDRSMAQAEVSSVSEAEHRGRAVSVLHLAAALAAAPLAGALWVLETLDVAPQILRCDANAQQDLHLHEITAHLHYPAKYALIEQGIKFDPLPESGVPTGALPVPQNVAAVETMLQTGSALVPAMTVSWPPPGDERVAWAQVQMITPDMTLWETVGATSQASLDIKGLENGEHSFRVRFLSASGQAGPWATITSQYVAGMLLPLPDVTGLGCNYVYNILRMYWAAVSDLRKVQYEVRRGESWASSVRVALTSATEIPTVGAGTYWVKARSGAAYSVNAASLVVSGDDLPVNAVASRDEAAEGWDGILGGDLEISGADLVLPGGSEDSAYTIPEAARVLLTANALCAVSCDIVAYAAKDGEDVYTLDDIYAVDDVYGADAQYIDARVQMRLYKDSAWGEWADFVVGQYFAAGFDFRVVLSTQREDTAAVLSGFAWTVDAPDRVWSAADLSVPDTGLSVTYDQPFAITPALVVQPPAGQVAHVSNKTAAGFDLTITEDGVAVATTADAIAKGY